MNMPKKNQTRLDGYIEFSRRLQPVGIRIIFLGIAVSLLVAFASGSRDFSVFLGAIPVVVLGILILLMPSILQLFKPKNRK